MTNDDRFLWAPGDMQFSKEPPVEKHLPHRHDQQLHAGKATSTAKNEFHYLKRATKVLQALKSAGGLTTAKRIFQSVNEWNWDDAGLIDKKTAAKMAKTGLIGFKPSQSSKSHVVVAHTPKAHSIASAIDAMHNFFQGEGGVNLSLRVKNWMSGHADPGLDFLWAATQLATPGQDLLIHRGMDVEPGVIKRLKQGNIKSVDVDTVGHWSEDEEVADEFSDGGVMLIAKVPKRCLLYSHRLENFSYDYEEEVVPLFSARPRVKSVHSSGHGDGSNAHLVLDLEFSPR